jgi:ubiquinone/menaquinone biosynthesis C-methylase UbiE
METLQQTYALGHDDHELDRLTSQARMLEPFTRQLLTEAGLRPGMRVLDIGCGSGDVSFLAADLVGPKGRVVGVDVAPPAIMRATSRAETAGITNVSFIEGDPLELEFTSRFDAIIGRLVLMYLPDPVDALRKLARHVHPGGLIALQEIDMESCRSMPPSPLLQQCVDWINETFRRTSARLKMGLELHSIFVEAGLPEPKLRLDAAIGNGSRNPIYSAVVEAVRTLMPAMERFNIATAHEVNIGDLENRLRKEIAGGTAVYPAVIGAWAQVPA